MMTLPLSLPRYFRHPSWYAPLLLPVLPILVLVATDRFPGFNEANLPVSIWVVTLLLSGLFLSLGLPEIIDRAGPRLRKEVDLFRTTWLVSVLAVQVAAGGGEDLEPLVVMLFAASCALMSAIPFGAEFQQRTLAGLLSQPLPRETWWRTKMTTLGVALALHWILMMVSMGAFERSVPVTFAAMTFFLGFVAWGSTPFWTLVSRGLLAGLVFSVTVPLLALAALSFLPISWDPTDYLLYVASPIYAATTFECARRRWLRLEAPDQTAGDGGVISLPVSRRTATTGYSRKSVLGQLVAKEFRVQTVTVMIAGASLVMTLLSFLPLSRENNTLFVVHGGAAMMALTGILLAGASTVAEERRMGTLDPQLLLPVSRSRQWRIKLGVASLLAIACVVVALANVGVSNLREGLEALAATAVVLCLFSSSLLASSGSNNALRALLGAVAFSGVAIGTAAFGASLFDGFTHGVDLSQQMLDPASAAEWRQRASALTDEQLTQFTTQARGETIPTSLVLIVVLGLSLLPYFASFLFARRNFLRPANAGSQLLWQFGGCYLLLLGAIAGQIAIATFIGQSHSKASLLVSLRAQIDWESSLTAGERQLFARFPGAPQWGGWNRTISLPPQAPNRAWMQLTLPLTPETRQQVINDPAVPENVRTLLRQEDAEDSRPRMPKGRVAPEYRVPMDPALLRRYGLSLPEAAVPPTDPNANSTPQQPPQPLLKMDPSLLRRYGLLPRTNPTPPAATPTAPSPAPPPPPKRDEP